MLEEDKKNNKKTKKIKTIILIIILLAVGIFIGCYGYSMGRTYTEPRELIDHTLDYDFSGTNWTYTNEEKNFIIVGTIPNEENQRFYYGEFNLIYNNEIYLMRFDEVHGHGSILSPVSPINMAVLSTKEDCPIQVCAYIYDITINDSFTEVSLNNVLVHDTWMDIIFDGKKDIANGETLVFKKIK